MGCPNHLTLHITVKKRETRERERDEHILSRHKHAKRQSEEKLKHNEGERALDKNGGNTLK